MLEILWEPGSQVPSEFTAQSLTEDELSWKTTFDSWFVNYGNLGASIFIIRGEGGGGPKRG